MPDVVIVGVAHSWSVSPLACYTNISSSCFPMAIWPTGCFFNSWVRIFPKTVTREDIENVSCLIAQCSEQKHIEKQRMKIA